MGKKAQTNYSEEFKKEVVRMMQRREKSVEEISEEMGIHSRNLYRWRKAYEEKGEEAFPGKGYQSSAEEEIRKLRKELADTREERDILKKAISIFSRTK